MAASYTFQDLSGSSIPATSDNPFRDLINACNDDPVQIKDRYNNQLVNRNVQKRTEMLSPDFSGMMIDQILAKLEYPEIDPGFKDWRHCLVFWARPPAALRALIAEIQQRILAVAPNTWTMPQANLHMTAMEITHSLTREEIDALVQQIQPHAQQIADYTLQHRARLVKPRLNYDAQGLALQFLPATGEPGRSLEEDSYTYHHLRRDLFDKIRAAGVRVASRYTVPSAHLTIARFITTRDFETTDGKVDHAKVEKLISTIDEVNEWLEKEYWPRESGIKAGGQWTIGEEKGLDGRHGALWYGGGESFCVGKGF